MKIENKDLCYAMVFGVMLAHLTGGWALPIILPIFIAAMYVDEKAKDAAVLDAAHGTNDLKSNQGEAK